MLVDILFAVVGLVLLVVGAEVMIRGAVDLALRANISPLVVGLTVVSLGTSAPELLVSLVAAFKGNSDITLGNVVGSNISNIGLVLGLCVLVLPIEVERDAWRIHWPVMLAGTLLVTVLLMDNAVSRTDGLLLVFMLLVYIVLMIRGSRRTQRKAGTKAPPPARAAIMSVIFVILGVAALSGGAELFVEGAVHMAQGLGVSEQLIAVTIVALGTSMPELVTSLIAAFRGQPDISLGNLIGSNIFNLLAIIGITAVVKPIEVALASFTLDMAFMLGISLLLFPLMRFGHVFGRWKGSAMLLAYAVYMLLVIQRG